MCVCREARCAAVSVSTEESPDEQLKRARPTGKHAALSLGSESAAAIALASAYAETSAVPISLGLGHKRRYRDPPTDRTQIILEPVDSANRLPGKLKRPLKPAVGRTVPDARVSEKCAHRCRHN